MNVDEILKFSTRQRANDATVVMGAEGGIPIHCTCHICVVIDVNFFQLRCSSIILSVQHNAQLFEIVTIDRIASCGWQKDLRDQINKNFR